MWYFLIINKLLLLLAKRYIFKRKRGHMKTVNNGSVYIINQFEVPKVSEGAFIEFFSSHIKLISIQPGNTVSRLFKSNNDDDYSVYISIVGWESKEAFKKAGIEIESISRKNGVDVREFQSKHKIKVINRIFSEVDVL